MKTFYPLQSGFSLVEVLVSITILLMVIVGPMTMISRANNSTSFATEQINAWFLAQEGLELIEMQRDKNLLNYFRTSAGSPWGDFADTSGSLQFCYNSTGCGVWVGSTGNPALGLKNCSTIADCKLLLNTQGAVRPSYVHPSAAGTPSLFTRVITMKKITDDQVQVTATVTWRTGTLIASQKVEATTYLFNIYDTP